MINPPNLNRVINLLEYRDGRLYWRTSSSRMVAGERAGSLNKRTGYRYVGFDGVRYKEHRIIYFIHHGYMPPSIDHRDDNKQNNLIDNLRSATKAQNEQCKGLRSSNKSGVTGVYYSDRWNKYRVHITVDGKERYLGQADTILDAAAIRRSAELKHFGEFACQR